MSDTFEDLAKDLVLALANADPSKALEVAEAHLRNAYNQGYDQGSVPVGGLGWAEYRGGVDD